MVSRTLRFQPLIFLCVAALSFVVCFWIATIINPDKDNQSASTDAAITPVEDDAPKPDFVDFQPILDQWVTNTPGAKGIIIYDLNYDRIAAEYQPNSIFATASLYKLFPVYVGYTAVEKGDLNPSTQLANGHTVAQCLDLAIRESNSTCAELLIKTIGTNQIQQAAEEWGTKNTDIANLQSTPEDILKVLQKYYQHPELSTETYAKILDSMLDQPPTSSDMCDGYCDWRQGLPSGFSAQSKAYNKVGWDYNPDGYWDLYHDAALVEIPSNLADVPHHYAIIVMTNKINPTKIAALGAEIEKKVLDSAHN